MTNQTELDTFGPSEPATISILVNKTVSTSDDTILYNTQLYPLADGAERRSGGSPLASNRLLHNGNLPVLEGLLSDVVSLRASYADSRQGGIAPISTAIDRIFAFFHDDQVMRILDYELQQVRPSLAPTNYATIPARLMDAEEQLGSRYGFKGREVRRYVSRAYELATPEASAKSVQNCHELVETIGTANEAVLERLKEEPIKMKHRLGRQRDAEKTADILTFSVGVLVADALQRSAFPLSYFVATTHLNGILP